MPRHFLTWREDTSFYSAKYQVFLLNSVIQQVKERWILKWVEPEPTCQLEFWVESGWVPGGQISSWIEFCISSVLSLKSRLIEVISNPYSQTIRGGTKFFAFNVFIWRKWCNKGMARVWDSCHLVVISAHESSVHCKIVCHIFRLVVVQVILIVQWFREKDTFQ